MTPAFDTLKLAERLAAGGFTQQQAQTAAAALSDALTAEVASKSDVAEVKRDIADAKREMKADMQALRLQLEAKIAETKADLLKWIVSAIGLQTIVLPGALLTLWKNAPH